MFMVSAAPPLHLQETQSVYELEQAGFKTFGPLSHLYVHVI